MSGSKDWTGHGHSHSSRPVQRSPRYEDPWQPRTSHAPTLVPSASTTQQPVSPGLQTRTPYSLSPAIPTTSRSLSPHPPADTSQVTFSPRSPDKSRSLSPQPRSQLPSGSVFFNTIKASRERNKLLAETNDRRNPSDGKLDLGNVVLYLQGSVGAEDSTLDT